MITSSMLMANASRVPESTDGKISDTKLFHWAGFTFDWYSRLMRNRNIIDAFFNSLKLAALSSLSPPKGRRPSASHGR